MQLSLAGNNFAVSIHYAMNRIHDSRRLCKKKRTEKANIQHRNYRKTVKDRKKRKNPKLQQQSKGNRRLSVWRWKQSTEQWLRCSKQMWIRQNSVYRRWSYGCPIHWWDVRSNCSSCWLPKLCCCYWKILTLMSIVVSNYVKPLPLRKSFQWNWIWFESNLRHWTSIWYCIFWRHMYNN